MTSAPATPARARDDDDPRPGRRLHPGIVAGVLAVILGVAGLVVGARTSSGGGVPAPEGTAAAEATPPDAVRQGDVTVSGAYVREPASPDVAAAYFTIRNGGREADSLESAYAGAATKTTLHGQPGVVSAGAHAGSGPVALPAGAVVTLTPGKGHVMLEGLTGTLRPGDEVSLLLRFARAGQVLVEAPVVAIGALAPDGATS